MTDASDWTDPGIGYRWIKANVYGALVMAAFSILSYAVGSALAVDEPATVVTTKWLFVIISAFTSVMGYVAWGRLTAGVLARRLPGFPVRAWTLLQAVIGLAEGAFLGMYEIGMVTVEPDPDAILGTTVTVLVVWALLWAFIGWLEALVLRTAAQGILPWIGYAGLAGVAAGISVLVWLYWPQYGWSGELTNELNAVLVLVITAIIRLPAVRRLEPRAPVDPAAALPGS